MPNDCARPDSHVLNRAREFATLVAQKGGRAYFVGGCVRDGVLGIESKDFDIEVHGIQASVLEEILNTMGGAAKVGKSFGVYKLLDCDIDIALPRREVSTGKGHKDFSISPDPSLSIKEASRRRDFTMNALYKDILTSEIIDCYGGLADLRSRTLKHVDDLTFGEDPLRVLRCAQFAARFDMQVDAATLELCRSMSLYHLPHERVAEETKKALLQASRPSRYFRTLQEMGQLGNWFREVEALVGVEQNPRFHPEGDVFEHTMLVLDSAASLRKQAHYPLGLMVSALCHDMGKPQTTMRLEDGKIVSYGHEDVGVEPATAFVNRVFHEKRLKRYVANMVKLHMRPGALIRVAARDKSFNTLFDKSCCPADLCLLSQADGEGCAGNKTCGNIKDELAAHLQHFEEIMAQPYVTGDDLIDEGVAPGAKMGEVLRLAHKLRLAGIPKAEALSQCLGLYRSMQKSRLVNSLSNKKKA